MRNGRSGSLVALPPPQHSAEYCPELALQAARILYRSPLPISALPVFIVNSAAFPEETTDAYDAVLPYILARLPGEEELLAGPGYTVVFFAGSPAAATGDEELDEEGSRHPSKPGFVWLRRAHQILQRLTRKKLTRLYVVHERRATRVVLEMLATLSPKARRKIVHDVPSGEPADPVSSLTALALQLPIEDLLIPPAAYLCDRRRLPDIAIPYVHGSRAFGVLSPSRLRLPRVLRETTNVVLQEQNVQTEGLFRISARAQIVDVVREAYDRGQKFVIWKHNGVHQTWPHAVDGRIVAVPAQQLAVQEGYDVHTAAALIKLWYRKHPSLLTPEACNILTSLQENPLYTHDLLNILPEDIKTVLAEAFSSHGQQLLQCHLLPMLARIAQCKENKMSASSLAICFAPTLVHESNSTKELQMVELVSYCLTLLIQLWQTDTSTVLQDLLETSDDFTDWEDPILEAQACGRRPELPPRPASESLLTTEDNVFTTEGNIPTTEGNVLTTEENISTTEGNIPTTEDNIHTTEGNIIPRKPVPTTQPPRYSSLLQDLSRPDRPSAQHDPRVLDMPQNALTLDNCAAPDEALLPSYEQALAFLDSTEPDRRPTIPRKPVAS